jgi:RecA-family ATPase
MKKFLTIILLSISINIISQIKVVQFNANWNAANGVDWLSKLTDCRTDQIDIAINKEAQAKYKIVVVPTIVVFNHGEEVKRFQANIMMKMEAKLDDVQTIVDETVMESF